MSPTMPSKNHRLSLWLTRVSFFLLSGALLFGLVAGVIIVPTYAKTFSDSDFSWATTCYLLVVIAISISLLLNLPNLGLGLWNLLKGRRNGEVRLLAFGGTLLVIFFFEMGSHLFFIHCNLTPQLCELYWNSDTAKVETSITGQWHLLHHSLVAAPFWVAYYLSLRHWYREAIWLKTFSL